MEELKITIEVLECKKSELQLAIASPFEYGRSPDDGEYFDIGVIVDELRLVQSNLDFANELLDTIISNGN